MWRAAANRLAVLAVNRAAEDAGLRPGQSLADARALYPKLLTAPADAGADLRALASLAAWCRRFSPWTAPIPADESGAVPAGEAGLWLEVTGCAHLLGGEAALVAAARRGLERAGFEARAGLAGTPGAALGLARFAATARDAGGAIATPGSEAAALALLPVAALRLGPDIRDGLEALGLRRVGELYPLMDGPKRAALGRRFPPLLLSRLDAALGRRFEPISPSRERPRFATRLTLPEPSRAEAVITHACRRLVDELAALLAQHGLGARRFVFTAFDAAGGSQQAAVETARPLAAVKPLMGLFALKLGTIDAGRGIDGFCLEAFATAPLPLSQGRLDPDPGPRPPEEMIEDTIDNGGIPGADLAPLIDRLHGRFGRRRVGRIALRPNHLPERAQALAGADASGPPAHGLGPAVPGPRPPARPLRLFPRPEPIDAMAEVPDGPPVWLRWRGRRHTVAAAAGPERIALDWWTLPGWQANPAEPRQPPTLGAAIRDYYRVETEAGLRLWVYRAGLHRTDAPARWFLHGVFP